MWFLALLAVGAIGAVSAVGQSFSFYTCTSNHMDYYSSSMIQPIVIEKEWTSISTYGYSASCDPYNYVNTRHAWVGYAAQCKKTEGLHQLVDSSKGIDTNSVSIPQKLYKMGTGIYRIKVYHPYIDTIQVCIHKGKSRIQVRAHQRQQRQHLIKSSTIRSKKIRPLMHKIKKIRDKIMPRPIHITINNIQHPFHEKKPNRNE